MVACEARKCDPEETLLVSAVGRLQRPNISQTHTHIHTHMTYMFSLIID